MTVRDPDSPMRRMAIAVVCAVAFVAVAGLVYIVVGAKDSSGRFNGGAIVAAARAYTRDLQARKQPIPQTVTLEELVANHFLQPGDIEAFRGLKATIMLTSEASGPQGILMRVRMPDGSEIVLLGNGSVQQVAK